MSTLLRFSQFKSGTTNHHVHTEVNEFCNHHFEVHQTGSSLTDGHIIDTVTGLQFCVFVQLIDNHLGNCISFKIKYNAGSFPHVTLIVHVSNALNYFLIDQLTDAVGEHVSVHLVGYFGDYDLFSSTLFGIDMASATHHYPTSSCAESFFYAFHPKNDSTCREIRRLDVLHQLINRNISVLDESDAGIY